MNNIFKDKNDNFVEIDEVVFYPTGGGMVQHMRWHAFHQQFEPASPPSEYKPVKVTLDTLPSDTAFEAYHTGQLWNGWLMPVFRPESVKAIVAATEAAGWSNWVQFKEAEKVVCVQDDDETDGVTTFCEQTIVIEGQPVVVYQVGDGICWEEVTPADQRSREEQVEAFVRSAIEQGKREILEDVASSRVPSTVTEFAKLHDYVDANEYGGLCEDGGTVARLFPRITDNDAEEFTNAANRIQEALDAWLKTALLAQEIPKG